MPRTVEVRIAAGVCALASAAGAFAQITANGLGTSVNNAGGAWSITAGTQRGGNLFHSFSSFSIPTGNSATFSGPGSVLHIIGRVTGPDPSSIDGLLRSTIPGADLWLINPQGVNFGPNASLNVQGSLHVSTADYLKLGSRGRFNATNPGGSTLVTAPPSAFGFLSPPAGISMNGATLAGMSGKSLSLVGGDLAFSSATVQAPSGRLNLASLRSAGEVSLDAAGITTAGVTAFGDISAAGSTLESSSGFLSFSPSGPIYVVAGKLTMTQSTLRSDNNSLFAAQGGDVDLRLSGALRITGKGMSTSSLNASKAGSIRIRAGSIDIDAAGQINASTLLSADSGDISIRTGGLRLSDGGYIASTTFGTGNGGNVVVDAGSAVFSGFNPIDGSASGIFAAAEVGSSGKGGTIDVHAASLTLQDGGVISASTRGYGAGGNANVVVDGALRIAGTFTFGSSVIGSGIHANSAFSYTGDAGSISVSADRIDISDGGRIAATTAGQGNAGHMDITARELDASNGGRVLAFTTGSGSAGGISLDVGSITLRDGGFIDSSTSGAGSAGSLRLSVGSLSVSGGGYINSSTYAAGRGGSIVVDARAGVDIHGYGSVTSGIYALAAAGSGDAGSISVKGDTLTLSDYGTITAHTVTAGKAGDVAVQAREVSLSSSAFIGSATYGVGNGGNVAVSVADRLSVDGVAGIFATTQPNGSNPGPYGNGGSLRVEARSIELTNGGSISAASYTDGRGGNVGVVAQDTLLAAGKSPSGIYAGVFASANAAGQGGAASVSAQTVDLGYGAAISADSSAGGNAGDLSVSADVIRLHDGGVIQSSAFGAGNGGDVSILARSLLYATGFGADGLTHSGVSAHSSHTATGAAGSLSIAAGAMELHDGAQVDAATFGVGAGGRVTVDVAGRLLIEGVSSDGFGSGIAASTSGSGRGGSVVVRAGDVAIRAGGVISASTHGSGAGGDLQMQVGNTLSVAGVEATQHSGVIAETHGSGNAGSITLTAGSIDLSDGGEISASSFRTGNAGVASISAGNIRIAGVGSDNARSGIFASGTGLGSGGSLFVTGDSISLTDQGIISASGVRGNAGNVSVTAGDLGMSGGGRITSSTRGVGHGGNISIAASRSIILADGLENDGSGIFSQAYAAGDAGVVSVSAPSIHIGTLAFIGADTFAGGRGGDIFVSGGEISVVNGGSISANAYGAADSGSVHVNAARLTIAGRDAYGSPAGIFAASQPGATGKAGSIFVDAGSIDINDGGISAATYTRAKAGDVSVRAGDISIAGGGLIESSASGGGDGGNVNILASGSLRISGTDSAISAVAFDAPGKGGSISIAAKDILLADGGQIAAFSLGSGTAGSIHVTADTLKLYSNAAISTEASSDNGGDITIQAGKLVYLKDSAITTSVNRDTGSGGNITIDPTFVILDGGRIEARAAEGRGGNIDIVSDFFLTFRDWVVDASSDKGISGTVLISSPNVNLGSGLVVLPSAYLDASRMMRASCAASAHQASSTFMAGTRGGVAQAPEAGASGAGVRSAALARCS